MKEPCGCETLKPGFRRCCRRHWNEIQARMWLKEWRRWGWPDYRDRWEARAAAEMRFWFMRACIG